MKKTLVALAVAAMAATSANAVVVYNQDGTKVEVGGKVRLLLAKETDKRADLKEDGSRVSFKATHDLGEGLSAIAYTEIGFEGLDDQRLKTRRLYAGFEHKDIGTLTFGKMLTNGDNFGVSDLTYKFSSPWASFQKSTAPDSKIYFADSGNKVIHFASKTFNGFSFGADYVFGDSDKNTGKNNAYLAGIFYHNTYDNGVNVEAEFGYTHKNIDDDNKAKSFKTGLGAGYAGFFFGADYAQTKITDQDKIKAFQVAAKYQINDMSKVYTAYKETKQADLKEKGFAIGAGYKPHKLVETFVEYNTFKSNKDNAKRDNKVYGGLRIHF